MAVRGRSAASRSRRCRPREDHLAAVDAQCVHFFLRFRWKSAGGVFVAFGEEFGLQQGDVLDWRRIPVDDDVVDDLERGEIERTQFLRNVGRWWPLLMCRSAVMLATSTSALVLA